MAGPVPRAGFPPLRPLRLAGLVQTLLLGKGFPEVAPPTKSFLGSPGV